MLEQPTKLFNALSVLYRTQGFRLAENADEINIVYVEGANEDGTPNSNKPDGWNDRRIVFTGAAIVGNWSGTSEPGKFYTENPLNPGGVARIALGFHKSAWKVGTHNTGKASAHEALVQCNPIRIHRDKNRDFSRTGDAEVMGASIGLNQHHGWNMAAVGRASAGCLVGQTKKGHAEFMSLVKADPRYRADCRFAFDTAVVRAADLEINK